MSKLTSSKKWQARQLKDVFRREANLRGLKSRAAFKLLQINDRYHLFKPGQTVVDLGYAPGSWSQVAADLTRPNGRVLGIDVIPARPPKGVSTIQGNFLSPRIQEYVRAFLRAPNRGRPYGNNLSLSAENTTSLLKAGRPEQEYLDRERDASDIIDESFDTSPDIDEDRTVDIVLSDMSAPWWPAVLPWKRSLNDPYHRMMNTSGLSVRDHSNSMDLCSAALEFGFDTLKPGGHFVCKFYQGEREKEFESRLKSLFEKVHREKPESSRKESREAYFVGLKRRRNAIKEEIV